MFLNKEILPHYQNSQFFRTYANSNKMSGPLHVWIKGCILYEFNVDNPSFVLFPFWKFSMSFKTVINKGIYMFLIKLLPTMTSIWLNYINSFWLLRKCTKACFCMIKHIDISRTIINFLILERWKTVKLEEI